MNRELARERKRRYRAAHLEEIRVKEAERMRRYRAAHLEEMRAKERARRAARIARGVDVTAHQRAWVEANREHVRAQHRAWRTANRERINGMARARERAARAEARWPALPPEIRGLLSTLRSELWIRAQVSDF